ncbi:hypothetical protein BWQ96_09278 [Gracilariopsis chorda]|uniref:Uncharacterized protein n=1 Tax=Gracilariopsis chorda TaxID=448386 RepID=A0A2V3IG22_9FLOR|nr:hypothetical protein BWQ96_09278 [Gracilariopsis chorda]|eukprot:PXF41011.1 hypothetical protein BWQ96_09278 [Gracilariopsis chorda]
MGRDAMSHENNDFHPGDEPHPLEVCKTNEVKIIPDMERVQRKWQMASCNHFLHVFADKLPLREISVDTAEDLTPETLERAIAEPERSMESCIILRDVLTALLVSLEAVSLKNSQTSWFQALRVHVNRHPEEFGDCFQYGTNVLERYENGMDFLVESGWHVRLGLLLALCDITAERAKAIRDAIRESEVASTLTKSDIDQKGYRLQPLGRCSQRRFHYKIGKTRIYSGYKRKGNGALLVECSDSSTMSKLAESLGCSPHSRDTKLSTDIRTKFLAPLQEHEERVRRKMERKRLAEIQREESRRRNSVRPRRSRAAYL